MDSFLFSMLPRVVRLPLDQVPWHYNAACNTCMWNATCRQRTERDQMVSNIPDLGIEEASFLRDVIRLNRRGATTDIEELDLLVSGGLQEVQQKYPTTASRFRTLMGMKRGEVGWSPVLEAVKSKTPQVQSSRKPLTLDSWQADISFPPPGGIRRGHISDYRSLIDVIASILGGIRHHRIPQCRTEAGVLHARD